MDEQVAIEDQTKKDEESDMESLVSQELMPRAQKDSESMNAMNIPKEDVNKLMETRR
jgi:hypothetical protein|tara:strand:+ start:2782 stop:2952 length:171 start_codon:yes stop_codon:yes gene_type:complete